MWSLKAEKELAVTRLMSTHMSSLLPPRYPLTTPICPCSAPTHLLCQNAPEGRGSGLPTQAGRGARGDSGAGILYSLNGFIPSGASLLKVRGASHQLTGSRLIFCHAGFYGSLSPEARATVVTHFLILALRSFLASGKSEV